MFYLVCQVDTANDEVEDVAFDEVEQMATVLWAMIWSQQDDYRVHVKPKTKIFLEPTMLVEVDATAGYEVKIRVGLIIN